MQSLLYVALGGAAGSLSRYGLTNWVTVMLGRGFPYGTLIVNLIGSLAIGLFYTWAIEKENSTPELRLLVMTGLLGAFTTFSTFSLETIQLLEEGDLMKAMVNVLLSVLVCLSATYVGILSGRIVL